MSNLLDFAKRELEILGGGGDKMQKAMNKHILHMVEEFSKEGHSGFSASYAIGLLSKLLRYKPITPLTGNDDEWNDMSGYGEKTTYQNNRCFTVFKDETGVYDSEGKIFEDKDGTFYTNRDSRVYIKFPYYPNPQYIKMRK